jgi:hypothetical protein
MNSLIVGGCYQETCISPIHDMLGGSGLRALEVLARVSPEVALSLGTTLYSSSRASLEGFLSLFPNAGLHPDCPLALVSDPPAFAYLNPLAPPRLEFDGTAAVPGIAEYVAECALVFGTIEAQARVTADVAVYDPQNPVDPRQFWENGSTARRCALVLNHNEAMGLSGEKSIFEAVKFLKSHLLGTGGSGYEVIVVKMAHAGCWVCSGNSVESVPAYRTPRVFSIGSGDVFSAVFHAKWALEGVSPADAADFASRFTAGYCATGTVPSMEEVATTADVGHAALPRIERDKPIRKKRIYLAGPFFTQGEISLIDHLRSVLTTPWTEVFSPLHDVGYGPADRVYKADIDGLETSDIVFAVLNGSDPGTIFEIGYAAKSGKPVFCLAEAVLPGHLTMIEGSGAVVDSDITTVVYKALWATLE